jgi:hypothetical protein
MKTNGWIGSLAKAEMKDGKPHLVFLATGPEEDKQGERVLKAVSDKVVTAAKAGTMFLAPSHDVPLQLAKSVDGWMDDAGHTFVDFLVDEADPMAMKVFKGFESGDWTPTVSMGAEKVTREVSWEGGKAIKSISDIEIDDPGKPVHLALAFPSRNVYPLAGIAQAMRKALGKDPEELKKRLWPEESIQKALMDPGWPPPPTFGERWRAHEVQDDMPDMMDILRWTIEDTVSPYTSGTDAEKRGLVIQSVNEFLDSVLGEIDQAAGSAKAGKAALAKADTTEAEIPPADSATASQVDETTTPPTPITPPGDGVAEVTSDTAPPAQEVPEESPAVKALRAEMDKVKGDMEALQKAMQAQTPDPNLGRTTDPASAPHTGLGLPTPGAGPDPSAKKALQEELDRLRKSIDSTADASVRAGLIQEHGALLSKFGRM